VEESVTGDVFEDFLYTSLLPKLFPFNGENAKSVVIMITHPFIMLTV